MRHNENDMKTKLITALLIFVTTFGFSTVLTSSLLGGRILPRFFSKTYNSQAHYQIVRLLRADIRNGERQFAKLSNVERLSSSETDLRFYADTIEEYVSKSEGLNDRGLPAEVLGAWNEHMQAWRTHVDFLQQTNRSDFENESTRQTYRCQDAEISRTWYKLLAIAGKYGELPADIY